MYTIDTNALVYLSAQEPLATKTLKPILRQSPTIYLPTVVTVEYLAYPKSTESDVTLFLELTQGFTIQDLTQGLALVAGNLRSQYGLKLGDSIVAATALETQSIVLTRNVKDFRKVPGLKLHKV